MPSHGFVRLLWVLALAFIGLCLAALGIIAMAYNHEATKRIELELGTLARMVDFKVQSISAWLDERRANASSASSVPAVAADLNAWLHQGNEQARDRLNGFLMNLQHIYGFSSVALLRPDGQTLIAFGDQHAQSPELMQVIDRLPDSVGPQLLDLHRHAEDNSVRLGFIAPIIDQHNPAKPPSGILFFGLDASHHLYLLLKHWPDTHSSIEIDLMRAEGADIVYLSPMRHQPETLLAKRSVSQAPSILPGLDMTSDTKPYKGKSLDYRGKAVLVAGRPVPGTPWHLLIKQDQDEALEGLLQILIQAGLMAMSALIATFAILGLWWQRQHLQETETRARLAEQLRDSEENYRTIFSKSRLPTLVIDADTGLILNANESAINFYGYSLEQLLQTNIKVINTLEAEEIAALMAKAKNNHKSNFDFCHRLASGEIRDVEVFSGPLKFNGKQALFSVVSDVTERKRLEQQLQTMATTDALTGLPNRRHFLERLQEQLNLLARGASQCASLMMLDLDHFKAVNDTWGHAAGDQVLQQLASIMREQLRKVDIPGRIGGEEFAILLPGIGPEEARTSAERLRLALAGSPRILSDGTQIQQTLSIGICRLLDSDLDTTHPLARADKALYQAKAEGRNRTVMA